MSEDTRVERFLTSQIASDSGMSCGLYLVISYTNPGAEYQPRVVVAVEAPNGAKQVLVSLVHTFETNTEGKYTGWSFFNLAEYVAVMERFFTQVPVASIRSPSTWTATWPPLARCPVKAPPPDHHRCGRPGQRHLPLHLGG